MIPNVIDHNQQCKTEKVFVAKFYSFAFVLDLFDDVIEEIITRVPEPIWSSNQRPTLSWQENERTAIES